MIANILLSVNTVRRIGNLQVFDIAVASK